MLRPAQSAKSEVSALLTFSRAECSPPSRSPRLSRAAMRASSSPFVRNTAHLRHHETSFHALAQFSAKTLKGIKFRMGSGRREREAACCPPALVILHIDVASLASQAPPVLAVSTVQPQGCSPDVELFQLSLVRFLLPAP